MHKNAKTLVILIDIFLYGVLLHSLISCVPKVVSVSGLLGFSLIFIFDQCLLYLFYIRRMVPGDFIRLVAKYIFI